MVKIFKCYSELDAPKNMLFVGINQIKKIIPYTMPNGRSKLIINYYDEEFCLYTTFFCDNIVAIDLDVDEDYKIWRNN